MKPALLLNWVNETMCSPSQTTLASCAKSPTARLQISHSECGYSLISLRVKVRALGPLIIDHEAQFHRYPSAEKIS